MFADNIQDYLPEDWIVEDISSSTVTSLPDCDPTYSKLSQLMIGNFKKGPIKSIFRIENPFLYCQYLIKKEEYKTKGNVQELELLHSTSISNMYLIAENNFNRRFVSRAKYGLGVSFTPSPEYANRQASLRIGLDRAMIVADVLVGMEITGHKEMILPPANFDTTTGGGNNVYVKYYDNEFYPKYAIHYQSCKNPRPQRYN